MCIVGWGLHSLGKKKKANQFISELKANRTPSRGCAKLLSSQCLCADGAAGEHSSVDRPEYKS